MTWTSYQADAYQAGDGLIAHKGRKATWTGADKLIVVCHGRTPAALAERACLQWAQSSGGGPPHLLALAERGYAIMCIDAGGNLTWGNSNSETAVSNAILWGRNATRGFASPTKKVLLVGYSMGGAVATNYANSHPTDVAGLLLEAPGVDLDYFYNNGYAGELDAAYGGSYSTNGINRNPMAFAPSLTTPTRIYTAADDTVVPPAIPHAFYDALPIGNKLIFDLPDGGHTNFWYNIDQYSLNSWVDSLPW